MANLFPDFRLEMFINYRQKDYNGDKCAGEFTGDLKNLPDSEFTEGSGICFSISQQRLSSK